ncbi:unnamed protein product [Vitrella brassicaformis CCMP3155]|uniref:Uncharacterized protein n=1 Tax=Vitrella brassicaformis (strain CCMP3155) TaxID=1169540 RepID=A0A0G4EBU0_VITBC|nr:unnamed protein product [Vitrella brassicaformis CCMP3155]|eukprot:CEL92996.1 unnamed protein product [Vitrella brassicaformis CCMP3155]
MRSFLGNEDRLDIVLNCLSGHFIGFSLALLRPGGWFVEIGKRGIWSREKMAQERTDVNYEAVALDVMIRDDPVWFRGMLNRINCMIATDQLTPPPIHAFDLSDENEGVSAAFTFMQPALHIGKIVLTVPSALGLEVIEARATQKRARSCPYAYVITGGLGGLGLVVAAWLIEHGAKSIILASRRGQPTQEMQESKEWQRLETIMQRAEATEGSCITLRAAKCDLSSIEDCRALLTQVQGEGLVPKAILHAAGTLSDATIGSQTLETIADVYGPKVQGAWAFHDLLIESRVQADTFLVFSSIAGLLGNSGRSNHAAANVCLDALVTYRRSQGLAGSSIQWGARTEQGKAAQLVNQHQLEKMGFVGVTNDIGLRSLWAVQGHIATIDVICCQPIRLETYFRVIPRTPFFSCLEPQRGVSVTHQEGSF